MLEFWSQEEAELGCCSYCFNAVYFLLQNVGERECSLVKASAVGVSAERCVQGRHVLAWRVYSVKNKTLPLL